MKRGVAEQCAPLIGRREGVCEEPEDKSAPGRQSQACSQIAQRHTKRRRAGREQSCVVQSTTRGAWVAVLVGVTGCGTLLREASAGVFFQDEHNIKRIGIQGWVVPRVTFFHRKHFCRSNSSQACSPAPVDGIRAQDHPAWSSPRWSITISEKSDRFFSDATRVPVSARHRQSVHGMPLVVRALGGVEPEGTHLRLGATQNPKSSC